MSYWSDWRAAHPEYRERERARLHRRDRTGRDRSGEYAARAAKRVRVDATPLPVLYAELVRGARLSFWEDELRMDLAQEAELARLEGADPVERCKAYRSREMAWRTVALTPLERIAA